VLFGSKFVTPIVAEYLQTYPEVSASCLFLDRIVNMMDEGIDVAIRIGELPDSSMQAVRVGQVRRVICGAPHYLKKQGLPRMPADLQDHVIISANSMDDSPEWTLTKDGIARAVSLHSRFTTSTNDSAITAAIGGFGLTRLLSYQIADFLRAGQLKTVLSQYEPPALPIHVVHREGRHASKKARAFIDLAVDRLRADKALN
jgi:DNA-binding transcriptional LysR family regulator